MVTWKDKKKIDTQEDEQFMFSR